jgi:hypothetical protein
LAAVQSATNSAMALLPPMADVAAKLAELVAT